MTEWAVAGSWIGQRSGGLPASIRAPTVRELTRSRANTEASGPKVPPVSLASAPSRAVLTAIEPPRSLPETVVPKR